jgi:hypothetical protein
MLAKSPPGWGNDGCGDSPSGPDGRRDIGITEGVNPDDPHFVIPAEVDAGKPFDLM